MHKTIRIPGLAVALLVASSSYGQLFISSGTTFNIQTGGTVTVQGDIVSSADITGAGKVILKGSANQNVNMNGFTVPNLEVDNPSNVTLTGNARVGADLLFTNGRVQQGNFDVILGASTTITGANSSRFLVTNGTGRLVKQGLAATAFTYPVGNSTTTYNPVTVSNSGTTDDIGVRCLANVLSAGSTGTAFTKEVADASWDISEATAGGSNLSLTTTWSGSDELAGFNRARGGISYYIPTPGPTQGWDLLNSQTGAAAGADPYTYTRTGINSLGVFAVGTRPVLSPLLVTPKVFLQGPFNTGTAVMGDGLRTANLIPTTEPYTSLAGYTHVGSGGGETTTAAVVGSGAPAGNDAIVDWVFVSVHDGATGTVVSTRSALLQRDGDVVETDGTSPLNMAGNAAGNYFVSVRHRNHIGVRSLNNMPLAKTVTTPYNYTTAQTQAFPGAVSNTPMAALSPSVFFGMWAGDATGNRAVRYSGPANDENQLLNVTLGGNKLAIISGYLLSDLNLNGQVRYSGPNNDETILLNTALGGNKLLIISQPIF